MNEVPPGLRLYFQQHNRRATFLALGCLLGSVIAWTVTYGLLMWAELLFLTAINGVEIEKVSSINWHFLILAAVLFVVGSVVRRWKSSHAKFHLGFSVVSIFSIPARLTYAIWDNFSARVHPTEADLVDAWTILECLHREKKIPRTHIPALLDSQHSANRVTFFLAIVDLLDTDNYGGIDYHHLQNQEAERLVRRWSRSLSLEE